MREVHQWTYRTLDGTSTGYVKRLEETGSNQTKPVKKQIIPYFTSTGKPGIPADFPRQNRIYGVETISNQFDPLFIAEGEKCAAALHGLGYQAITSLGGCHQADLADWAILQGMVEVIILPDNDIPGLDYAKSIYQNIRPFLTNTKIQMLRFPLNEKADICDYLKTLPELSDWNEFDSLKGHIDTAAIRSMFDTYVTEHAEPIPANWKFIVSLSKHKLIAANDFCKLDLPERKMLLGPWLTEGSINMVFADRGIGKTFFCLSCAIAIANGEGFLSYEAPAPTPVLYLDGEMQGAALQERIKLLTNGKDTKAPLLIYTPDLQDLTDSNPDIGLDTGRIDINALIEKVKPKAVFIDNISTFIRTGNENEGDSWAPVQEWAVQQRKKGIAITFIHHANKEGKQRGSHKKEDVMDVVLQLKRPDDFIAGEDDTRLLVSYTKSRHLQAKDTQDMEATLRNEEGTLVWSHTNGNPQYLRCVELLNDNIPYTEIAKELSVSKSTVSRWKSKAASEGLLRTKNPNLPT